MRSSPARPERRSAPPRPSRMSAPALPVRTSGPLVPMRMTFVPSTVAGDAAAVAPAPARTIATPAQPAHHNGRDRRFTMSPLPRRRVRHELYEAHAASEPLATDEALAIALLHGRPGKDQGRLRVMPDTAVGARRSILCASWQPDDPCSTIARARGGTDYRTPRHWRAASLRPFRACEGGVMFLDRLRRLADRPYPGRVELAALAVLYGAYEVVRGFGGEDWAAARAHTADIVALERRLNLFVEQDVQDLAGLLPGVPALLGLLYVALHFAGTAGVLIWVHRRRRHAFPFVRTTLIVSTGARARRLRPLSGRPAAAREPRLRRHRQHAHGPEPQLRPARQPLQPDRGRAQPPLRLRADRRRRRRPARLAALAPPPRRRVSRADAPDHRRDRQPLPLRRRRRRPRRRRRLARGRAPARLRRRRPVRLAAPNDTWTPHSTPSHAQAA